MKLFNLFKPKNQIITTQTLADFTPLRHYHSNAYASAYPSIRAITNEYMTVRPFAIDKNGKKVDHEIIDVLYHPNQTDSSVAFAEKIAVMTLTMPKTYILVHSRKGNKTFPGGDFTKDRIGGLTFLEYPTVNRRDGKTWYNLGEKNYSEDEVLVLTGGVDPYNLYSGYSPAEASRRWAKLDDYIADYEIGFFENGAVPAGMFVITASTTTEYNDIVDKLQDKHRGAGKNGNVTYSHRPVDISGKAVASQVEWIPFAQSNKDIDFQNLFKQVNEKIDSAFGVPAIVKGIDDKATYANAQVADKTFSLRAVNPLLLRNYTQLTHELNRITNGLGVAITYKYKIPAVSDEEKVNAERKQIESAIIVQMTTAGYSLETIVNAFELSNSYKLLSNKTQPAVIENDKPDVDEGGEVKRTPKVRAKLSDEQKMEAAARKYMNAQIDLEITKLNEDIKDLDDNSEQDFIDEMLIVAVSVMIAYGIIQYAEGETILKEAGLSAETMTEFKLGDKVQDDYKIYLKKVAQSYSKDTGESIRTVLAEAQEDGLNRREIEKKLKGILDVDDYRIKRLARTELNRSQATGGLESMKQIQTETGYELEKTLSHAGNPTTPCVYCQAQEGVWVKVTEPLIDMDQTITGTDGSTYVNDFATLHAGDIHPNGKGRMEYRVK